MGYRSDVFYAAEGPYDRLNPVLMAFALKGGEYRAAVDEVCAQRNGDTLTVRFGAPDVKWYPEYQDVAAHVELYEALSDALISDEGEDFGNAVFLRIGEEDTDIEQKFVGDGALLANISRVININVADIPKENDYRRRNP